MKKELAIGISLIGISGCTEFQQSQFYKNMQASMVKIENKLTGKEQYCLYENVLNEYSGIEDLSNYENEYLNALRMYKQCDVEKSKIYEEKYNNYLKKKEEELKKKEEEQKVQEKQKVCEEELACSIRDNFEGEENYLSMQSIHIWNTDCSLPQKNINQRLSDLSKVCSKNTVANFKKAYEEFSKAKEQQEKQKACEEELACSIRDNFEGQENYLSMQYIHVWNKDCSLPQKNIDQRLSDLSKVCSKNTVADFKKAYENFSERKKEIAAEEEQKRLFEKEKQNLSKKYGKPFCETDPVREKNCIGFLNRNNLFGIPEWEIFQQASDGSLIRSRMAGGLLGYDEPVFIMKNSTDSSLVDNETLPTGVFTRVGNYSYTTVLGGNKTIIKLKRLE